MQAICLNFQIHLPLQFRLYRFFDIGRDSYYFDDFQNEYLTRRATEKYLSNTISTLQDMIARYGNYFNASIAISGISLDLLERYQPQIIQKLAELAKTGQIEFVATPYHHSLASIRSAHELKTQTLLHQQRLKELFGTETKTFSNTGLIYSDEIGELAGKMGFEFILAEGAKHVLGWKSPNFVYQHVTNEKLKILLRNFELSNDIGYRFSNKDWSSYPLTAEKFLSWINVGAEDQNCLNLILDCKSFGEINPPESGIFDFLKHLPEVVKKDSDWTFKKPSDLKTENINSTTLYASSPTSWAGEEKDLSLWNGNDLQKEALDKLYSIEKDILCISNPQFLNQWRILQNADCFYQMNTKKTQSKSVYNPYHSPFDAFINYMNILNDFMLQVETEKKQAQCP